MRVQNRDWRQARKRTAEGRFADDANDADVASAENAAEAIQRAVARNTRSDADALTSATAHGQQQGRQRASRVPERLAGRVTALRRGDALGPAEEGEEPEVPSVHIGSRLAARLSSYPDPGSTTLCWWCTACLLMNAECLHMQCMCLCAAVQVQIRFVLIHKV